MKEKHCSRCKVEKQISEFNHDKRSVDGLTSECKKCRREYYKFYINTPHGKAMQRATVDRYRLSPKGRRRRAEIQRRFAKTTKGKVIQTGSRRAFRQKFPERERVYKAVAKAVNKGLLPHPSKKHCQICGCAAHHYHHEDYSPEHYLDVIPLCRVCHAKLGRTAILLG